MSNDSSKSWGIVFTTMLLGVLVAMVVIGFNSGDLFKIDPFFGVGIFLMTLFGIIRLYAQYAELPKIEKIFFWLTMLIPIAIILYLIL